MDVTLFNYLNHSNFDQNCYFFIRPREVLHILPTYEQLLTVTELTNEIFFCIIQIFSKNEMKQTVKQISLLSVIDVYIH
jgi:hypothetical protein